MTGFCGNCRNSLTVILIVIATAATAAGQSAYTIAIDESLSELRVHAQLDDGATVVRASGRGLSNRLSDLSYCDGTRARIRRGRVALDTLGPNCLTYAVSLRRGMVGRTRGELPPSSHYRAISPSEWLLLPDGSSREEVTVLLELPAGMTASVPWTPIGDPTDHLYAVPRSPRSASATVVFGRFPHRYIPIAGGLLRAAFFGIDSEAEIAKLSEWLRQAADNVTLIFGRFPNPSPQVMVINTPRYGSSPVTFGRVVRNGGEAVTYYVNAGAAMDELRGDWTATHEFSHLMLPYVDEKWVSEGFATYHQNILLARAGVYSDEKAWGKLLAGFGRGRLSVPHLSPLDASRGYHSGARMKVYWAGVVLALMADVELRERSNGRQTLGSLLAELQTCCLPADRAWRVPELFKKIDSYADAPVLLPLYQRYATRPGFPDYEPLLGRLGVTEKGGTVYFDDAAELGAIRRELTIADIERAAGAGREGARKSGADSASSDEIAALRSQ